MCFLEYTVCKYGDDIDIDVGDGDGNEDDADVVTEDNAGGALIIVLLLVYVVVVVAVCLLVALVVVAIEWFRKLAAPGLLHMLLLLFVTSVILIGVRFSGQYRFLLRVYCLFIVQLIHDRITCLRQTLET